MKHHRLGGSTTKRYFNCAYSIPATEIAREKNLIPKENRSNSAARKGTAVHTLCEKCLETGCDPIDYSGTTIKVENEKFIVDGHMIKAAEIYVDECREQMKRVKHEFKGVELNSELSHLFDGEDVGGPCDFVCYGSNTLVVMDYKNGTFPVEIDYNTQFLKYALGVYEQLKNKYSIKNIRIIVVQPNCNHMNGPIRRQDLTLKELLRWKRRELRPAINRVKKVTELLKRNTSLEKLPTELQPHADTEYCYFCPINGICKAHAELNKQLLQNEFKEGGELILPAPNTLTVDEAEQIIEARNAINKWLQEVYEYRKHALENGDTSTRFKIVESVGNRVISNEQRAIRKLSKLAPRDELFKHELHSPAQLEKIIYKHQKEKDKKFTHNKANEILNEITIRPPRGNALVSIKDGRETNLITAQDDFKNE